MIIAVEFLLSVLMMFISGFVWIVLFFMLINESLCLFDVIDSYLGELMITDSFGMTQVSSVTVKCVYSTELLLF